MLGCKFIHISKRAPWNAKILLLTNLLSMAEPTLLKITQNIAPCGPMTWHYWGVNRQTDRWQTSRWTYRLADRQLRLTRTMPFRPGGLMTKIHQNILYNMTLTISLFTDQEAMLTLGWQGQRPSLLVSIKASPNQCGLVITHNSKIWLTKWHRN